MLTDTGPAIIISALTNILADTVGTFTGCPEITLLSYGNMACIGVDFLYQVRLIICLKQKTAFWLIWLKRVPETARLKKIPVLGVDYSKWGSRLKHKALSYRQWELVGRAFNR